VTAGGDIAARAQGYGVPSAVVDGNDLWAVHTSADEAVQRARRGEGPTLLECRTYRHYGHSKSDPGAYRSKDELEAWLERDPLKLARQRLAEDGVSNDQLAATEKAATDAIERAVEAALAAPYPDPAQDAATEYRG
jgi:pyruvate dehydrogenase E1 component alpha subunit